MRLVNFLNEQSSVESALKVNKPDSTEEYSKEEATKALNTLTAALKSLKNSDSKESKAAAKDIAAKLRAWVDFSEEKFESLAALSKAKSALSGKAPKKISAPVRPDSALPVSVAMKAGTLRTDPETIKDLDKKEKEEEE